MVFAALYLFGLKAGVGANTLSLFFKMVRIDTHVGVSVSALRVQINQMETLLPEFQALCEKQVTKQPHKIIAGLDETFFSARHRAPHERFWDSMSQKSIRHAANY